MSWRSGVPVLFVKRGGWVMENLSRLIEESIELELNAAGLYALFHFALPEDGGFWWQLHQEERNHASLLASLRTTFLPADIYPDSFVLPSLEKLTEVNTRLNILLEKYRNEPPGREEAFHVALELENSAGELHFQKFADQQDASKVDQVFRDLISGDKDHMQRILRYMKEHGIAKQGQ
jgi:ferritin